LTTANNFRKQLGFEYNRTTGDLESSTSIADAMTVYNKNSSNPMSDIYVSKSAFISSKRLFIVLGHEFVHSSHYKMGLFTALTNKYGMEEGNKLFLDYSESSAYTYTLVTSKNLGEHSYANFIRRHVMGKFGFGTPKAFGWRKLGIPTQMK
jgi:hypothetical protein